MTFSLLSGSLAGVGYYALSLVRALARIQSGVELILVGADPAIDRIRGLERLPKAVVKNMNGLRRVAWQQTGLPYLASRLGLDLLHCPDFSRPLFCSVPVLNTIHDISYYAPQPFFPLAQRTYKRTLARVAMGQSAGILADSKFTREEIHRRFRIDERKVKVVHLGVDKASREVEKDANSPYMLFVGTLEERKDVTTLIRAFTFLRSRAGIPHRLILVGKCGFGWKKIKRAIDASPFREDIEFRGYEKRQEVLRLYGAADLFVYPSVYEGFGLPVLEAMAWGTAVVCSRAASLPEVAGDAAEYFEPGSVEGLATAMGRVLGSPERQAELRRKGLERVKLFSWDECARRHLAVYRELAGP